jgi:hypothetical protein
MKTVIAILSVAMLMVVVAGISALAPPNSRADAFMKDANGFDYEYCQAECRRAYGGYEWAAPALRPGNTFGYNNCLLACERKQWKALDRETDRELD